MDVSGVTTASPVPASAGKSPDLRLELPGRLLRAAAVVLAMAVVAIAAFGAWRAAGDTEQEMAGALALATLLHRVTGLSALDDDRLLAELQTLQQDQPLRHLQLGLLDGEGRLRLGTLPQASPPLALAPLRWTLERPAGPAWTLLLGPSPESEQREARAGLLPLLALVVTAALVVLALLRWQLHRALMPMRALLRAIEQPRPGQPLPAMPVRELQALSHALTRAQEERERLGRRLQTVQEQTRQRLAQELHDELGQRLTAMRLDATVLQRTAATPEAAALAAGLAAQVQAAQFEVRDLLARLAPRKGDGTPAHLAELLTELASAQRGLDVHLSLALGDQPLSEDLANALFRLSQEGLTNICRHAQARQAWLSVSRHGHLLRWQLADDGVGVDDMAAASQRGSGLAGMRDRIWAWGGDLLLQRHPAGGLQLSAELRLDGGAP